MTVEPRKRTQYVGLLNAGAFRSREANMDYAKVIDPDAAKRLGHLYRLLQNGRT